MKTIYHLAIFTLLIAASSCSKSTADNTALQLTTCPENTDCSYQYANEIDFNSQLQAQPGNFRTFYYINVNHKTCDMQTHLYFKTGIDNQDFSITKTEILNGSTGFKMICACCSLLDMKPIDGFIKGSKKDGEKWLVNAHIVLGTSNGVPLDTLDIRQYFTPLKAVSY